MSALADYGLDQILDQVVADTLQPNTLTVRPDGSVSPFGPFLQLSPSGDPTGLTDLNNLKQALQVGIPSTIFLLNGDFNWGAVGDTEVVTVPANTRITGEGPGTIVHTDITLQLAADTEVDHIQFKTRTNLQRNANGQPTVNAKVLLQFWQGAFNCSAHDLTGDGLVIEFNNVTGFEAWSNAFAAGFSSMGGIQTFNASSQGRVWGNRVTGSNVNGIGLNNSSDITIALNGCYSNGNSGISPQNGCTDIRIVANKCNGNTGGDGIDANSGAMSAINDFTIALNHCSSNSATGIYCVGSRNKIVGNTCVNNGTWGIKVAPFGADNTNATNLILGENICEGNTSGKISVTNAPGYIAFGNDGIADTTSNPIGRSGGTVTLNFGGANPFTNGTINFPVAFANPPSNVQVSAGTLQPGGKVGIPSVFNVTAAQASVQVQTFDNSIPANGVSVVVQWEAHQ